MNWAHLLVGYCVLVVLTFAILAALCAYNDRPTNHRK